MIGAFFRLYGLNWDQGFHLHPDERAIVMFTTPLEFPKTINEFFSPQSTWNPHFFAYGSFPLYFLKIAGNIASIIDPTYAIYDRMNLLGRFLSAIFDIGTLIVLFFLSKKLFSKNIGLLASFFYTISILPIQLSHFYAVDTPLTFFILLTLYQLIRLYEKPTFLKSILVGFFFGLSLATKTSALVLITSIGMAIAIDFLLIFIKQPHKPHIWLPHVPKFLKHLITYSIAIFTTTFITFIAFEPYALIDFPTFWQQQLQQRQMTYDPFTFPYTLQYVGKIPYWHEIKNIFLWGQGPLLATISFIGAIYFAFMAFKKERKEKWAQELIIATFFWIYFLVVGKFAIGFMRYMLPLYPLLCLFSALLILRLFEIVKNKSNNSFILNTLYIIFYASLLVWPLSFINIYSHPNTRILTSEWIYKNIPANSIIAREHWDDGVPIGGNIPYQFLELPIYEMQNPLKKNQIYQTINKADYIIIASNRLYVPLQRIAKNCQAWHMPLERCSYNANTYYEKLFNGSLGFQKVAEFSIFPSLEIRNFKLEIRDEIADESFTVYDHPKIMIFKKNK